MPSSMSPSCLGGNKVWLAEDDNLVQEHPLLVAPRVRNDTGKTCSEPRTSGAKQPVDLPDLVQQGKLRWVLV